MIKRKEYIEYYWNDYMEHERRFARLLDYVALHPQNLNTCSDEIISQILLLCTSFEGSMKAMYTFTKERPNIDDYLDALASDTLFKREMAIQLLEGKNLEARRPFEGTSRGNSPKWWKAYNALKHNRILGYTQGTLENLIDSLAALYYINMLHVKKIGDYWLSASGYDKTENAMDVPNDVSRFFELSEWDTREHVSARNVYIANDEDIDEMFNKNCRSRDRQPPSPTNNR